MPYSPSSSGSSGPINPEERKHLQMIEKVASDRGPSVARGAVDAATYLPRTAWRALVSYTTRQPAAMAGVLDVLQGTGREGEGAGHRFLREVIGGTKLGDKFGFKPGDQEFFGEVFKQGGMGEGPSLSDAIGDNWVTRKWDPNARGAAGLGADILSDPLTWVTGGAGGFAKMAGKAGVIVASKKAHQIAARVYVGNLARYARKAGLMDDIAKLAPAGPQRGAQLEKTVLTHARNEMGMESLGGRGIAEAMLRFEREAAARVVEMSKRGKVPGLDRGSGIRFGSLRWLGFNFGGVKVMDFEKLGHVGVQIGSAIRTGKLGGMAAGLYQDVSRIDEVFNRLPLSLRRNSMFKAIEARRHTLHNSAEDISNAHLNTIFEGVDKKVMKDLEFQKAWADAADDKRLIEGLSKTYGEVAGASVRRWHVVADEMGGGAARMKMIEPDQYARISQQGFFPRSVKLNRAGMNQVFDGQTTKPFSGGELGHHAAERELHWLGDLRNKISRAGLSPDAVIEYDPIVALGSYMQKHIKATAGVNFAVDVVGQYSPSFGTVFRNIAPDMDLNLYKLPDAELNVARNALNLIDAGVTEGAKFSPKAFTNAIREVSRLSVKARAAFLAETFTRAKTIDEFNAAYKLVERVMDELPIPALWEIRDNGFAKLRIFDDMDMGAHKFTIGKFKDKQVVLPKEMLHFFADNEGMLANGLPKAASRILKYYDIMQNTFKTSHTILFPAFHIRNGISNKAAMAATVGLHQVFDPSIMRNAYKIMNGVGDFTIKDRNGRHYTRQQLTNLFEALDITPKQAMQVEMVGGGRAVFDKIPVLKQWEKGGQWIGKKIENYDRAQYFLIMLKNGHGPDEAARLMKQVLFDYSDLSVTERELIKRLIPFWAWTRKNAELQIRNLATRPAGTLAQVKAFNNVDRGPDADLLPHYVRGDMVTQLKAGKGKALFITNIDLPISNIDVLWAGGVRETLKEQFGMFSPLLKAPLEWGLNLDTFSGQSISGRKWMGAVGPKIENGWPKWAKETIGLKRIETRDGRTFYTANGTIMYLIMKNMYVGRMVQEGTKVADIAADLFGGGDTKLAMMKMFNFLSGMKINDVFLTEAQEAKYRRMNREVEDYLIKGGHAAEYRSMFFPKAND